MQCNVVGVGMSRRLLCYSHIQLETQHDWSGSTPRACCTVDVNQQHVTMTRPTPY